MLKTILIFCVLLFTSNSFAENILKTKIINISNQLIISTVENDKVELSSIIIPEKFKIKAKTALINQDFNDVTLKIDEKRLNRYGNIIAYVKDEKRNLSLQEVLVQEGLAYVYTTTDNDIGYLKLLELEEESRNNNKGLWQEKEFKIQAPQSMVKYQNYYKNKFAFVKGYVKSVKFTKKRVFINFGDDWKKDFTVSISNQFLKNFDKNKIKSLKDKEIQVRGWIASYNGPFMDIYHLGHLEIFKQDASLSAID